MASNRYQGRYDIGEAIYRALSGRSPFTEVASFGGAVGYLLGAAGGNIAAAARMAGVPRKTFADWARKGVQPKDAARRAAVFNLAKRAERRARLPRGREKRIRKMTPIGASFTGVYRYDQRAWDKESRDVKIGPYMDPNVYNALCDAFLNGASPEGLRAVFAAHVDDPAGFYQTVGNDPSADEGWGVSPGSFRL